MSPSFTKLHKTISKDMQVKLQCKTLNRCGIFRVVIWPLTEKKKDLKIYIKSTYTVNVNIPIPQLIN